MRAHAMTKSASSRAHAPTRGARERRASTSGRDKMTSSCGGSVVSRRRRETRARATVTGEKKIENDAETPSWATEMSTRVMSGILATALAATCATGPALAASESTRLSIREEIRREERAVVDEVIRDEQIGLEAIREGATAGERLDMFLEKEPPVAIFFTAMLLVNGSFGLIYTLFVRETDAGPGGEFGKGIVALRKEVVKGIFAFFNSALGRYTTRDGESS